MSELTIYICPKCGGEMSVSPKDKFVQCSYCGLVGQRELDSYEQAGMSAQMLAQKLMDYRERMPMYEKLRKDLMAAKAKLDSYNGNIKKAQRKGFLGTLGIAAGGAGVIIILIAIVAGFTLLAHWIFDKWWIYLIGAFFAVSMVASTGKDIGSAMKDSKDAVDYDKDLEVYNRAKKSYDDFCTTFDVNFVAEQYRNTQALDYVINLFNTNQAANLGDAFRRYDEYQHYARMEAMQKQQLDLQKKQFQQMGNNSIR